ncbi:MAG: hypothetical protein ACI9IP_003416 [Arcticibacterium sp.]|jgi:hypothetical protein
MNNQQLQLGFEIPVVNEFRVLISPPRELIERVRRLKNSISHYLANTDTQITPLTSLSCLTK